jgi:hypothetical protein
MSKTTLTAALGALALVTLAGCAPRFDHLDFVESTSPPLPADLAWTGLSLTEGIAVGFTPLAMTADGPMDKETVVSLTSGNPGVLGLDHAVDTGYVVYGVSVGHTTISVFIDGEAVGTMPAAVVAPP